MFFVLLLLEFGWLALQTVWWTETDAPQGVRGRVGVWRLKQD